MTHVKQYNALYLRQN